MENRPDCRCHPSSRPAPQAPLSQCGTGPLSPLPRLGSRSSRLGWISIEVDHFECPAQPRRRPSPPLGFRAIRLDRECPRRPSVRTHVQACFPQGLQPRSAHGHFAHGRMQPLRSRNPKRIGNSDPHAGNQQPKSLHPDPPTSSQHSISPSRHHRPRYRYDNPRGSLRRPYPPKRHAARPADLG